MATQTEQISSTPDSTSMHSDSFDSTSSPSRHDAVSPSPTSTPTPNATPTSSASAASSAASLLSLIESCSDPIIFVESSDHMLLALPLPIARRCHALITKHLHSDLTEYGTALISTVTGEAMARCVGYVQHEWQEIEKRKEKLAVIMKARGQKGSDKMVGVGSMGDGPEKEGGGRRGRDREKNLLASVQRAQQQLVAYFQAQAPPSPSLPPFPPPSLGVSPPSHPLSSLLAPSSTIPTSPPSLAYSINHLLCELASSAYYLEIPPLVDLTCQRLADSIQGKSAEEIRTTFNITNDFTPMEEEVVKQRVMERTLLYPGGIEDGRPGVAVGEEERGLMAGLSAGLGGAVGGSGVSGAGGVGGAGRLGVREQLKVKLAEKRMAQMREKGLLGHSALSPYTAAPPSAGGVEERKMETKRIDDAADGSGAAASNGGSSAGGSGISSAAKKKKKKKAKKKGKSMEDEEEKEPSSPPSPASLSPLSQSSQQQRLSAANEDEQKAALDGSTYELLQSMASSLTSSVASLPRSNMIPQIKPIDSSAHSPQSPTAAKLSPTIDSAAASTLRQFTVADLCDPHEPSEPLFPPRVYPEPTWHHLRLLLKCAVSTSGLQWLRPYFPTSVYMYVGLTLGPSSASPLLHVCYDSEAALTAAVQSQLLTVLYPLLYAPPTVLVDMIDMWRSGRLMRCCDWCGLTGHMRGWEGCGMKDAGDGYVSRSVAVEEANPPPAQLMTLRFVFRLALTSAVLIPLSGLLPHALFLHLGFHPLYSTPTHVLHVTFSSSAAMQTCLLSDVPSILHLMHSPPRIQLMDVSGYDVRDVCSQCGEMGRHNGGECDVERDSRGLDPLSSAMLPPTSFATFAASSAPPSAAVHSQQPHILTALGRVIEAGKVEEEMKRGAAADPSRTSSDEEDDDGAEVDDSRPLSELIDAKLMGLQQWEQHQQHNSGNSSEHGTDADKAVVEMAERRGAADESAFSASTISSFFCSCPSPSPSIPLSSSALMSDLARCPFSPLLLSTMSLCSHCGLLLSSSSKVSSSFNNASLTADMQSMLMDADPAVLASLPYPLSAMFQKAGQGAEVKAEECKESGAELDRRMAKEDEVDEGVRSIQLHSVGLPPLLHGTSSDDGSALHPAIGGSALSQQASHPLSSSSHAASPNPTSFVSSSPTSSCPDCTRLQSQLTEQSSFSSKLLRLVEEQQKALAALQERVKKTEEREGRRREKWEERVKAIERMDERLRAMEKQETARKDSAHKLERRMAEESKRRTDIERWVEEETREKDERAQRDKRDREMRLEEERRESERREQERKERGDMRRLQSKWGDWERKMADILALHNSTKREEQWNEFAARMEREREKDRVEQRAERERERNRWEEEERRRLDDRLSQHSGQLQLHGDVLVRVDRKLQSLEQMLLSSDRVMSRQRMAELIGFDISDQ